jgi:hypothetical protein
MVEHLYIYEDPRLPRRLQMDMEDMLWLEILPLFTAVKNLYVSKELLPRIALALRGYIWGRMTEVLPTLQNVFLEGLLPSAPIQGDIDLLMQQHPDHSITVSHWEREERD